jgi:hypothetical protein
MNNSPEEPIHAGSFLFGCMVGIGKEKCYFIDMGLGYSFGTPNKEDLFGNKSNLNVFCFNFGFGIRIGNYKNTDNN